jgi:hypothetical protein
MKFSSIESGQYLDGRIHLGIPGCIHPLSIEEVLLVSLCSGQSLWIPGNCVVKIEQV